MKSSQFQYIESPALCTDLQASWFPPNTQRYIVTGPSSLLSIKNGSLYGTQGSKHILVRMNPGKSECITRKHLRYSIESRKLDIGWSGYLFSNNIFPLLKFTPTSWITNTWKLLREKNMVAEEKNPNLKLKCHRDTYIMEDFISKGIQGEEISELKRCRIFLKIACLSDIATRDGE